VCEIDSCGSQLTAQLPPPFHMARLYAAATLDTYNAELKLHNILLKVTGPHEPIRMTWRLQKNFQIEPIETCEHCR
jgi:hypothetical protein